MQPTLVVIANSLVPFAQEMPVILSLPVGARFRSRFPIKWVHSSVGQDPESVIGLSGILVLREWESAKLIPIRKVKFESISLLDDLLFLEYTVLEYASGLEEFEQKFYSNIDVFLRDNDVENLSNKPLNPLVFVTETDEAYLSDINDGLTEDALFIRWSRLVKRLCQLRCFEGHLFPKIDVVQRANAELAELRNGEVQLVENEPYDLRVSYTLYEQPDEESLKREGRSRSPNSPYMTHGPYELRMISGNNATTFSETCRKLSGRYDVVRIPFISDRSSRHSADRIRIAYSLPSGLENSFDASVYLDVKYRKRVALNAIGILAAFTMYILLSFSAPIFSWLPKGAAEFVQQLSLIILVIQVTFLIQWIRRI